MASVADASGTRTLSHSPDSLTLADAVQFQNDVFTLQEDCDALVRSAGYAFSNNVGGISSLIVGTALGYDAFSRALPFH